MIKIEYLHVLSKKNHTLKKLTLRQVEMCNKNNDKINKFKKLHSNVSNNIYTTISIISKQMPVSPLCKI